MNGQVFPVWTYSYLAVLVPVFLLTDWLRYKPVVVLQCSALFVTTAFLRWLDTVPAMQTMQFFYAVVTACEVAYFSYIYRYLLQEVLSQRLSILLLRFLPLHFLLFQHGGAQEVPQSHVVLPQRAAPRLHGGRSAGSDPGQPGAPVLQRHHRVHAGAHLHRPAHLHLPAHATAEHVLPPQDG